MLGHSDFVVGKRYRMVVGGPLCTCIGHAHDTGQAILRSCEGLWEVTTPLVWKQENIPREFAVFVQSSTGVPKAIFSVDHEFVNRPDYEIIKVREVIE